MKLNRHGLAALLLLACPSAHAASLPIVGNPANPAIRSIYLDGGAENGLFSFIVFKALPNIGVSAELRNDRGDLVTMVNTPWSSGAPLPGRVFANLTAGFIARVPRPAGQAFTYRNRVLDRDPAEPEVPGLGWTQLGIVINANELSFTGGPLGSVINTSGQPGGRLFIANVYLIPEPASFALGARALLGMPAAVRRTSKS